jgi:hypothetical protein
MKKDNTWMVLFVLATFIFALVGLVMGFYDNKYLEGAQYLFTSVILTIGVYQMHHKMFKMDEYASMGFIFTVVGLNLNVGVWCLGIVLLASRYSRK